MKVSDHQKLIALRKLVLSGVSTAYVPEIHVALVHSAWSISTKLFELEVSML